MTTVEWVDGKVRFIDQTCLPAEEVYVETDDYHVVAEAIRSMKIRGAPAIGVAAAFAILLAVGKRQFASGQEMLEEVGRAVEVLSATRPTAVNLFSALRRMQRTVEGSSSSAVPELFLRLAVEATVIYREDVESCRNIGSIGATLLPAGISVLTHCNAGALATAGEGTALAVIASAARQGKIVRVYAGETRPLFQGARLTAWELVRQGIETVLVTDNAVGSLLQQGRVQAVVVGADRIAANGDTANKIGTYPIAVLAARHRVPFYVAAPTSTFDLSVPDGAHIPIEERSPDEVTHIGGKRIAAEGVRVYAPAFDVTPASLVNAIVTEKGILHPPYPRFIAALFEQPAEETKTP
ncbi:MAG TPA: S-methyl-5-thioribose-1-phosphate isomerase [Bacteroidota bacterium]|nr:S-methyl-5-thioribose-1-phosphate isomerase [Bacteroidota bacterium]